MKEFTGRVAAVTGAGSGIGRALALRLSADGCHLALADIDGVGLAETTSMITAQGVRVSTIVLDVAVETDVRAWADAVVVDHGQVNMIINNAGVAVAGTVESMSLDDLRWVMDVNFWGVVHGTTAFLPHLTAAGEGHVVNVSSMFGLASQPLMSAYNASKFAVRGYTEALRQELDLSGSPVSATCVHPGGIKTGITRTARVDASVAELTGRDRDASTRHFERLMRTSSEAAAKAILDGVRSDSRRVLVGLDAQAFDVLVRLAPTAYQRAVTTTLSTMSRF